jgi:hypothetical protein
MDPEQFDALVKRLGTATPRRNVLRVLAGTIAGALLPTRTAAQAQCRRYGDWCSKSLSTGRHNCCRSLDCDQFTPSEHDGRCKCIQGWSHCALTNLCVADLSTQCCVKPGEACSTSGECCACHICQNGTCVPPIDITSDWNCDWGGNFYKGDPARPAVLLFSGMGAPASWWESPSKVAAARWPLAVDYERTPREWREKRDTPNVPYLAFYKVGTSPPLFEGHQWQWDDEHGWVPQLRNQGFTVATWEQVGATFDDTYDRALHVFEDFERRTRELNPSNPPPIALIGHSRGGLLIRRILKERGSMGRVRWAVTLHSPHRGSRLADLPSEATSDLITDLIADLTSPLCTEWCRRALRDLVGDWLRPLDPRLWGWPAEHRELRPGGRIITSLEAGESELADVAYHTFGGTSPRVTRIYVWLYDAMTIVPQFEAKPTYPWFKAYWIWTAVPTELGEISPIFDEVRDFTPEVVSGTGDGIVSDAAARLPASIFPRAHHVTTSLNHFQVMWDSDLQAQVMAILEPAAPLPPCPAGQTRCRDTCVDLQQSEQHCGSCDNACSSGGTCCEGQCCSADHECCNGGCCPLGQPCCEFTGCCEHRGGTCCDPDECVPPGSICQ